MDVYKAPQEITKQVSIPTLAQTVENLLDISKKDVPDVAMLRLYKDFGQRIIKYWRCLFMDRILLPMLWE